MIVAGHGEAAPCSPQLQRASIFYGNGITVDRGDAQIDATRFKDALQTYLNDLPNESEYACFDDVKLKYATNDGRLFDFLESEYEFRVGLAGRIWQILGFNPPPAWLDEAIIKWLRSPDFSGAYSVNDVTSAYHRDLDMQIAEYHEDIAQGGHRRRIVLVAHSQGTFFGNDAFDELLRTGDIKAAADFQIIALASPASVVKGGWAGSHVTIYGDPILAVPGRLDANTDTAGTPCAPILSQQLPGSNVRDCHSFLKSYLIGAQSRQRLLQMVHASLVTNHNQSPTARFTMAFGPLVVEAPNPLRVLTPFGNAGSVSFSAALSDDHDGTVNAWRWFIDSTLVATTSSFTKALDVGPHQVALIVGDDLGAQSEQVNATVEVTTTTDGVVTLASINANWSGGYVYDWLPFTVATTGVLTKITSERFAVGNCDFGYCSPFGNASLYIVCRVDGGHYGGCPQLIAISDPSFGYATDPPGPPAAQEFTFSGSNAVILEAGVRYYARPYICSFGPLHCGGGQVLDTGGLQTFYGFPTVVPVSPPTDVLILAKQLARSATLPDINRVSHVIDVGRPSAPTSSNAYVHFIGSYDRCSPFSNYIVEYDDAEYSIATGRTWNPFAVYDSNHNPIDLFGSSVGQVVDIVFFYRPQNPQTGEWGNAMLDPSKYYRLRIDCGDLFTSLRLLGSNNAWESGIPFYILRDEFSVSIPQS